MLVKTSSRTREVFMFKSLIALSILTASFGSTYAANPLNNVECSNQETTFKLIHDGNPRNGAIAQVSDVQGEFPFGGAWLWLVSEDEGFLSSQTKYKTMNGGILTVSEQVIMGRGGCGRGSCDSQFKIITAHYLTKNVTGDEYLYDCHKISN